MNVELSAADQPDMWLKDLDRRELDQEIAVIEQQAFALAEVVSASWGTVELNNEDLRVEQIILCHDGLIRMFGLYGNVTEDTPPYPRHRLALEVTCLSGGPEVTEFYGLEWDAEGLVDDQEIPHEIRSTIFESIFSMDDSGPSHYDGKPFDETEEADKIKNYAGAAESYSQMTVGRLASMKKELREWLDAAETISLILS